MPSAENPLNARRRPMGSTSYEIIQGWNDVLPSPAVLASAEEALMPPGLLTEDGERLAELLGFKRQLILGEEATTEVTPSEKTRSQKFVEGFVQFMAAISASRAYRRGPEGIGETEATLEEELEDPAEEDRRETRAWLTANAPDVLTRLESAAGRLRVAEADGDGDANSRSLPSMWRSSESRRAFADSADRTIQTDLATRAQPARVLIAAIRFL
jgi:hypothetical protein